MYDSIKSQGLYDPGYEHDSCGVGFAADLKGRRSHALVEQGVEILSRLAHRGAVGADPKTGDGAGFLIQMPHLFLASVCGEQGIKLPPAGSYGAGLIFLPTLPAERAACKKAIADAVAAEGQVLLGWRPVPVDNSDIGKAARETEPVIEQLFIGQGLEGSEGAAGSSRDLKFEKKLYAIRRRVEKTIKSRQFYVTSLSTRTLIYKGLLTPGQVGRFFVDLSDPKMESSIVLVHSRYSTNTFPTWDLAQPFRFLAHNGEINTLRGNVNWMKARGLDVIAPGGSDSASLDNVLELLVLSGRSLPHAMMMLIPQAWEHNDKIAKQLKDFYQYHVQLNFSPLKIRHLQQFYEYHSQLLLRMVFQLQRGLS